jgi:hypothetical protein
MTDISSLQDVSKETSQCVDLGATGSNTPKADDSKRKSSKPGSAIKQQMRVVIGSLECILDELKSVVGDLRDVVVQIDDVTNQIEENALKVGTI